jgi:hypothetical protein
MDLDLRGTSNLGTRGVSSGRHGLKTAEDEDV